MGTISTILDKVVPRVQARKHENKPLMDIIQEELEKEKYLDTDQSIQGTNSNEITFKDILPSSVDLDNGEIYDKLTGKTIREL